jgi:4-carboxymuconolactone decarboxylase
MDRREKGEATIRILNRGQDQPTLEALRKEFPFLVEATASYALGDVWSRPGLDYRTRQLAAVAAFAALGLQQFVRIHAGYALNVGASEEELKEIVHQTTVHAGFPRAIETAQTLCAVFAERRKTIEQR